jgi:hypothetical protein
LGLQLQAHRDASTAEQQQQQQQSGPPAAAAKQVKKLKQLAAQQQQLAASREATASEAQQQAAAQPHSAPALKQVKKKVAAAAAAAAKQAPSEGARQQFQVSLPATSASEAARSAVKQVRKRLGLMQRSGSQQQQQQLVPHVPLFTGGLVPRDGSGWALLLAAGLAVVGAGRLLAGLLLRPSKAQR